MTVQPNDERRVPVGRTDEIDLIRGVIDRCAAGPQATVLVSGEPGIGKTALVDEVIQGLDATTKVLWASCLPLSSRSIPLLPIVTALKHWPSADELTAPDLMRDHPAALSAPLLFDDWVSRVCARQPLVVVVDDLHWADQSTLDVVLYAIAGRVDRPLTLIATMRDTDAVDVQQLRRWLADVRRLPGVEALRLDRLDRIGTYDQVSQLLDHSPFQSLVDDVYSRTGGNPYLTALLIRGLAPDARRLPETLPSELRDALSYTWHQLSPPTRRLGQALAISGRPQSAEELSQLCETFYAEPDVSRQIHEAIDAGTVQEPTPGMYWFVHPLMAEVLEGELLTSERRRFHAVAGARLAEHLSEPDAAQSEQVIRVADHFWHAEQSDDAYRWAQIGATAAERAGGHAEALRLLRRSLDLLPASDDESSTTSSDLLERIRRAAERGGAWEEELEAIEELLAPTDSASDPLQVSELLVRRTHLRLCTGRQFNDLDTVRTAVDLAASAPRSPALALALAELAHQELWLAQESLHDSALSAVKVAGSSGSPRAMAYALVSRVMSLIESPSELGPDVISEGRRAQELALKEQDYWCYVHATLWVANCIDCTANADVLAILQQARRTLEGVGAPSAYVAWLASVEATGRLARGEIGACEQLLRTVLGSGPGAIADTQARLVAARIASRQGRTAEADAHLRRADEIFEEHTEFLAFDFDAVRAELALAREDHAAAVTAAIAGVESSGIAPTACEVLLPIAARALADLAQQARDHGEDDREATHHLKELHSQHPRVIEDAHPGSVYRHIVDSMNAVYDAEVVRGLEDADAFEAWRRAAGLSAIAEDPWTESYASWRSAEAGLLRHTSVREAATGLLRQAHELAQSLDARPLLDQIHALAHAARVKLRYGPPQEPTTDQAIPGLTLREREILSHVVAGETYGEIARSLFISEKTVSVHVSNLLRKTGTTNRVDLAQLATRLTRG